MVGVVNQGGEELRGAAFAALNNAMVELEATEMGGLSGNEDLFAAAIDIYAEFTTT